MSSMFAYIDPGVGLLAWQAVVAAVLGLVFYLKKTRNFLVSLVTKAFQKSKSQHALPAKVETEPEQIGK